MRRARRPLPARWRRTILSLERLEDRTLLSSGVSLAGVPTWAEQGPQSFPSDTVISGNVAAKLSNPDGTLQPNQDDLTAGAIQAIAVNPQGPNTVYVGTVNGGVWKTTDATDPQPIWDPLTDLYPSLAISALAFSPLDPTDQTLFAGTGDFSSTLIRGPADGLLETTDGGQNWKVLGQTEFQGLSIRNVVPTGLRDPQSGDEVVLAAAVDPAPGLDADSGAIVDRGGVYRNFEDSAGHVTWRRVPDDPGSGLPGQSASSLVVDPGNPELLYAAFPGSPVGNVPGKGIYRSLDGGATWAPFNTGIAYPATTSRIVLTVSEATNTTAFAPKTAYAAVLARDAPNSGNVRLKGLYQLATTGTWQNVNAPNGRDVNGAPVNVNPGGQGDLHFALAADPTNANVVYVAGDRLDATGDGNVYRVDATGATSTWVPVVRQTLAGPNIPDDAPHADARALAFDQTGTRLLEASDGGIYELLNPLRAAASNGTTISATPPQWQSLNGTLRDLEMYSVAYDPVNQLLRAGTQDNGSIEQQYPHPANPFLWDEVLGGDGAGQAVGVDGTTAYRYSEGNSFADFTRRQYDQYNDEQIPTSGPDANVYPEVPLERPGSKLAAANYLNGLSPADQATARAGGGGTFALNAVDPSRMVLGLFGLYESTDRGDTIRPIPDTQTGRVTALAYGGMQGTIPLPDVLYVARGDVIGVRGPGTRAVVYTPIPTAIKVRGIVMDPSNWLTAYAVDTQHVYETTDGGKTWSDITGSLEGKDPLLASIEVVNTGGATVLLVGGQGGVYRTFNPAPGGLTYWTKYGAGLPNAVVSQVQYLPSANSLLVSTLGRGAWMVSAADLATPGVLTIAATTGDNQITLARDANNPLLFDVTVNGSPSGPYQLADFQRIEVDAGSGDDTLTIDTTNGLLGGPLDVHFEGGTGTATLQLAGPVNWGVTVPGTIVQSDGGQTQTITYANVANLPPVVAPQSTIADVLSAIGDGLQQLATWSGRLDDPSLLGQPLPLFGTSLGKALNGGNDNATPFTDSTPGDSENDGGPPGAAPSQILSRIFQEGAVPLDLADVGPTITSTEDLRQRLEALAPGAVVVETEESGVVRYDMRLTEQLGGVVDLDVMGTRQDSAGNPLPGQIALSGTADVEADVDVHLVFGVDSQGFFIDPTDNPDPEVVVRNLRIDGTGSVSGSGQVGFLGVTFADGTLTMDDAASIAIKLHAPAGSSDGLLRPSDLGPVGAGLATSTLNHGSSGDDMTFTADYQPADGLPSSFTLGGPAPLTLAWPDLTQPANLSATVSGAGTDLLNFLNLSPEQFVNGLNQQMGAKLQASTGTGVLGATVGLTGQSLGDLLNGPAEAVTFDQTTPTPVEYVSDTFNDGTATKFEVFVGDTNLFEQGVAVGATVTYQGLGGSGQGTIDRVDLTDFTVRMDAGAPAPDAANPSFTIARGGSFPEQIGASLGTLADPTRLAQVAPTLQDLVARLSEATGVDLSAISVTFDPAQQVVQLGFTLHPAALTFTQHLDLSAGVNGFSFAAAAPAFDLTLDPQYHLTVALSVLTDAALGSKDRFSVVPASTPEVQVAISGRLDIPTVAATVGFLNVQAREATPGAGQGLHIDGTLSASLADFTPHLQARFSLDPLQLSAATNMGEKSTLSVVTLSLDGNGGGLVNDDPSALSDLAKNLTVTGDIGNLTDFDNISPATILAALQALPAQLSKLGGVGGLNQPLPLVNTSLGQLVDLGKTVSDLLGTGSLDNAKAATLQALETYLNTKLAPAGAVLQVTLGPGSVRFAVNFNQTLPASSPLPLAFPGGDGTSLVSVSSQGSALRLRLVAGGTLDFGVSTTPGAPLEQTFLVNDSQFSLGASANAGYDLGNGNTAPVLPDFQLHLGALPLVTVQNGRVELRATLNASVQTTDPSGIVKLSDLATHVQSDFSGDAQAVLPFTTALGDVVKVKVAGKLANLGNPAFDVTPPDPDPAVNSNKIVVPLDDSQLDSTRFLINVDGLTNLLGTLSGLDLSDLPNALDTLFGDLGSGLLSKALGNLPLIGADLKDALTKLKFLNTGSDPFSDVAGLDPTKIADAVLADLKTYLKFDAASTVTLTDPSLATTNPVYHALLTLKGDALTGSPLTIALSSDLGLKGLGLGLMTEGDVTVSPVFKFDLTFGLNTDDGFYLDTTTPTALTFSLDVTAPSGLSLTATLGLLQGTFTIDPGTTLLHGDFTVNLTSPRPDHKITFTDLTSGGVDLTKALDATVKGGSKFHIGITAAVAGAAGQYFPTLMTGLNLDWQFGNADTGDALLGGAPKIAFDDVKIDIGTFLSGFLEPIARDVSQVLSPIQPVLDVLSARLPVVSDLAGHKVTLLDLASLLGLVNGASFIGAVAQLGQVAKVLDTFSASGTIDLGSFDLGTQDVREASALSPEDLVAPTVAPLDQLNSSLGQSADAQEVEDFAGGSTNVAPGGGLEFPILDKPSMAFGLLLGKDADLFTYDMPTFSAAFSFRQVFPIFPPLFAEIAGSFSASAHFKFGFDTHGLREFLQEPATAKDPSKIFEDGFFIDNSGGPQLTLQGSLMAGASLDVLVAEASVDGGITATVSFKLESHSDPTKVRLSDIADDLKNGDPLCLFDVHGALTAGLSAHIKIGFDAGFTFVTIFSQDLNLVQVTLLDFDVSCPDPPVSPELASSPDANGTVTLFTGPNAGNLKGVNRNDPTREAYTVTHVSGNPGDPAGETVLISAYGATQTISGVKSIYAQAGDGESNVNIAQSNADDPDHPGVWVPVTLIAGAGNDTLSGGDGNASLVGGAGNDLLSGGRGDDTIAGGAGNDTLLGNGGNDTITVNGAGNNFVDGGDGNDVITDKGFGTNTLKGGGGDDSITAGSGHDELYGGDGNDTLSGGGSKGDLIEGGPGNNSIRGSSGPDIIYGDAPDAPAADGLSGGSFAIDTIWGGSGNSHIVGGPGKNSINGGSGNDPILAGPNGDTITGGFGNDTILGGAGDDSIFGGTGNDSIVAGTGNPTITGGTGDDTLVAGPGNDSLTGGSGTDTYVFGHGNFHNDIVNVPDNSVRRNRLDFSNFDGSLTLDISLTGPQQIDRDPTHPNGLVLDLTSGTGITDVIGGRFNDHVRGNTLDDYMEGQGGNDTLIGGSGNNTLIGGAGSDSLVSQNGNDVLIGDQGTVLNVTTVAPVSLASFTGGPTVPASGGGISADALLDRPGLYGEDYSPLPLTFPLLGSLATLSGGVNQTGFNGDVVLAGASFNDTLIDGNGKDIDIGDNAVVVLVKTVIPIDTSALLANGTTFPPTVIPRIGILGDVNQTGVVGNVSLNGAGADNTLTAGNGDDVLIGNNGAVVQLSVLALSAAPPCPPTPITFAPDAAGLTPGGVGPAALVEQSAALSLIGVVGNVTQTGVTGNVSLVGAAGHNTLGAGSGNDVVIGNNGAAVSLTAGSEVIDGGMTPTPPTGAAPRRLVEVGVLGNVTQTGVQGNVSLVGAASSSTLAAGDGNDTLIGSNGIVVNVASTATVTDEAASCGPPPVVADVQPLAPIASPSELVIGIKGNVNQFGVGGDVTLQGAAADNPTITGGNGNDVLAGSNAIVVSDTIISGAFNSGSGSPTTGGGAMSDRLVGVLGNVGQLGVGGAAQVIGQDGHNSLQAGDGSDVMIGANAVVVSLLDANLAGAGNAGVPAAAGEQFGIGGNVSLTGTAGTARLMAGAGDDVLVGGDGVAVRARVAPTADGSPAPPQSLGGGSGVLLQRGVIGDVALVAGGPNDTLTAGSGNDFLIGGAAVVAQVAAVTVSSPVGSSGTIIVGQGAITGNASLTQTGPGGQAQITGAGGNSVLAGDSGVIVSLSLTGQANTGADGGATTNAFAQSGVGGAVSLTGGAGNSTLSGGTGSDVMAGDNLVAVSVVTAAGTGNTTLPGGVTSVRQGGIAGGVTLVGQAGNNSVTGGSGGGGLVGNNAVSVAVSLTTPGQVPTDLETGVGGNISLTGDGGSNTLDGTAGGNEDEIGNNGILVSLALHQANPTLPGSLGPDTLTGAAGDVLLNGGAGTNTLLGSGPAHPTAQDVQIGANGFIQGVTSEFPAGSGSVTTVAGLVLVQGTAAGSNTLTGAAGGNTQYGDNGIYGAALADVLASRDVVVGADGNDSIGGGAGNDLMFGHNSAGVYTLPGYVLVGVTVTGGGGSDTLLGLGGNDTLFSEEGTDSLVAGAGNATMVAGPGNDQLFGGTGNDLYVFHDGWGQATITEPANPPDAGSDTITFATVAASLTFDLNAPTGLSVTDGIDTVTAAGDHIQNLVGGLGNDVFVFANGAQLFGGAGTIDGGGGTNTLDYSAYSTGIQVSLQAGGAAGTARGTASVKDIQNVLGGSGNDIIVGHGNANYFFQDQGGNDTLLGGTGQDTLTAGNGNDLFVGGRGGDTMSGGNGNDTFFVVPNGTTQPGGPSRDVVTVGAGGTATLDLSLSPVGVALNLDLMAADQVVDARGDVVRINGQIENLLGSGFNDALTAGPLSVPRSIDGGGHTNTAPGNVLTFDAHGRSVTFTGTTITATGFAPVTYAHWDNFNFINQGALAVSSTATVGGSQGIATDAATLATFSDLGGLKALGEYHATIDWRDGTAPTVGTLTISGGLLVVSGSHTYATGGTYHPLVTLSDFSRSVTATTTVNVSSLAADVSALVSVTRGGYSYNRAKRRFIQAVTITNTGTKPITGEVSLVLDNLSPGIALANNTGTTTSGSPYIDFDLSSLGGTLGVGQSISVVLEFTGSGAITYGSRVLAGTGAR